MTLLIHLGRIMTAGLGESLGEGEMVLMNDFQSMAASYSKQSPSSQRLDGSYLLLREK